MFQYKGKVSDEINNYKGLERSKKEELQPNRKGEERIEIGENKGRKSGLRKRGVQTV